MELFFYTQSWISSLLPQLLYHPFRAGKAVEQVGWKDETDVVEV